MKLIKNFSLLLLVVLLSTSLYAQQSHRVASYVNTVNPKQSAYMAANSIMIVGKAPNVRAISCFNASTDVARACIDCSKFYRTNLPEDVNVYLLVIPSAASFYVPDAAARWSRKGAEAEIINAIYAGLDPNVVIVDAYSALASHAHEDIYSRTDHHWAPLGGYYAAQALAKAAGVPFKDLSHYERKVVPGYVGSMYSYSKDAAVKNSPENFVYHKPTEANYETTYIVYSLASNNKSIIGESRPTKGNYFYNFAAGAAYCTFMGGDSRITQVKTDVGNGRRMLIVKDSFGNAIPGYLFYSFEEIHVVDFRFFNKNLKTYIKEHGITDVIISTSIAFAVSSSPMSSYKRLLVQ